jgi:hypothetical protein
MPTSDLAFTDRHGMTFWPYGVAQQLAWQFSERHRGLVIELIDEMLEQCREDEEKARTSTSTWSRKRLLSGARRTEDVLVPILRSWSRGDDTDVDPTQHPLRDLLRRAAVALREPDVDPTEIADWIDDELRGQPVRW